MTVAVRIIIMAIGGSHVQTSAINLSLPRPTAPSMSLIALLALLALDSNATNPLHGSRCTNGFSTGPPSDFSLQIRWARRSCQCGEQVDEVAFSI